VQRSTGVGRIPAVDPQPSRRRGRSAAIVTLLAGALVLATGSVNAASPSIAPTPEPLPSGPLVTGRAWLDAPLPTTASPGSTVRIGYLLTTDDGSLFVNSSVRMRLYPAGGDAEPATANGIRDWPGHYVAQIVVPAGGVGRAEFAIPGTFCNDAGQCLETEYVFEPIQAGPPTDVSVALLATARLAPAGSSVARRPTTIEIDVQPRVDWPAPGLTLPDELVLQVRIPQGPVVTEVSASQSPADARHFTGTVTLDQPGDYVIQLASTTDPQETDLFATALIRLTVEPAPAVPAPATPSGGLPEWWPLAAAAAALILSLGLIARGGRRPAD
jgi:hypothetical protein